MSYSVAIDQIKKAKNIAIICHLNPDGDTIGSGLALYFFLLENGKNVDVYCDDEKADKLDFLLEKNPIILLKNVVAHDKHYDLTIGVDCSDLERMGEARRFFFSADSTLVIDHHKTNDRSGKTNVVEPEASATAQIMFKLLSEYDDAGINEKIASLLYAGLLTDSGGFYYESTTPETHEVAAGLLRKGVRHTDVYYKVFEETERCKFELHQRVLSRVRFFDDGAIALIHFTEEDFEKTGTDISFTEGAVSKLQSIVGVKVSIAVTDVAKNSYKVSFRSRGDIDVSRAAGVFGGGGHKNASGCRLAGYYEDVVDKLLKSARDSCNVGFF